MSLFYVPSPHPSSASSSPSSSSASATMDSAGASLVMDPAHECKKNFVVLPTLPPPQPHPRRPPRTVFYININNFNMGAKDDLSTVSCVDDGFQKQPQPLPRPRRRPPLLISETVTSPAQSPVQSPIETQAQQAPPVPPRRRVSIHDYPEHLNPFQGEGKLKFRTESNGTARSNKERSLSAPSGGISVSRMLSSALAQFSSMRRRSESQMMALRRRADGSWAGLHSLRLPMIRKKSAGSRPLTPTLPALDEGNTHHISDSLDEEDTSKERARELAFLTIPRNRRKKRPAPKPPVDRINDSLTLHPEEDVVSSSADVPSSKSSTVSDPLKKSSSSPTTAQNSDTDSDVYEEAREEA